MTQNVMQVVDLYLDAWGVVKRRDARELKRCTVAQVKYDGSAFGGVTVKTEDGWIEVNDGSGRTQRVALEIVELTGRIVVALPDEYQIVLNAHFAVPGRPADKWPKLGISKTTYYEKLREAKSAFGAVWAMARRRVIQRGVPMRFDQYAANGLTPSELSG